MLDTGTCCNVSSMSCLCLLHAWAICKCMRLVHNTCNYCNVLAHTMDYNVPTQPVLLALDMHSTTYMHHTAITRQLNVLF